VLVATVRFPPRHVRLARARRVRGPVAKLQRVHHHDGALGAVITERAHLIRSPGRGVGRGRGRRCGPSEVEPGREPTAAWCHPGWRARLRARRGTRSEQDLPRGDERWRSSRWRSRRRGAPRRARSAATRRSCRASSTLERPYFRMGFEPEQAAWMLTVLFQVDFAATAFEAAAQRKHRFCRSHERTERRPRARVRGESRRAQGWAPSPRRASRRGGREPRWAPRRRSSGRSERG
jgi:hypothetical protein